jgi:Icc protein
VGESPAPFEVMTVSDEEAVLYQGATWVAVEGLAPDTEYERNGVSWRTLPRPPGERLATLATVNDLHFGEVVCGHVDGIELGPELSSEPGHVPYPEVMNHGAVEDIVHRHPDLVVAKGDITAAGRAREWAEFERTYGARFPRRLLVTRGNHDVALGAEGPGERLIPPVQEESLPGVTVALIDTSIPGAAGGRLAAEAVAWLDELAARADRPVLVMGHHPVQGEGEAGNPGGGLDGPSSARLLEVVGRRPRIVAYLAGHTHRNRVQRFAATGMVPFVEVACVKDFPGSWAEYRVYEGGILQIHWRIESPEALAWSERCRQLFAGLYPSYALGALDERCFPIWHR